MRNPAICVALGTMLIPALVQSVAAENSNAGIKLYMATDGRDGWTGRLDSPNPERTDGPFATLTGARDAVRNIVAAGLEKPVTVLIRAGLYKLDQPLSLGPEDSGSADCPITYAAYPGEQPVLTGAARVTAVWNRPAEGHVWTAQMPVGTRFDDLFVAGRRQPRARIPNQDTFQAEDLEGSHEKFRYQTGDLAAWDDLASAEIAIRAYQWQVHHVPIADIDERTRTVTLARRIDYPIVPSRGSRYGRYYIENIRAALDQPGEWCLNYQTGLLSYRPPDDLDLTRDEVLYPAATGLLALTGDAAAGRFVEHLNIRGLTFRHTSRNGAAVQLETARNCSLLDNTWTDVCRLGLTIKNGCRDIRIVGNEFVRTGGMPIAISGRALTPAGKNASESLPPTGAVTITDNHIHHCGLIFHDSAGISIGKSENILVAHNHIHHMPYIGIAMTGAIVADWAEKRPAFIEPPFDFHKAKPFIATRNNVIAYNHIHHAMQTIKDGGAIYAFGTTGLGPNRIHHNLIHHVGQDEGAVGIYLDDESDGYHVHDNLVYASNVGLLLHGSPDNTIENNIFAATNVADMWIHPEEYNIPPMRNVVRRNIWYAGTGELFKLVGDKWLKKGFWSKQPFEVLNHNLYWRAQTPIALGLDKGFDRDSLVADPRFVDPARDDYRLKPDSPALSLGFKPIDLGNVGIRPPGRRSPETSQPGPH